MGRAPDRLANTRESRGASVASCTAIFVAAIFVAAMLGCNDAPPTRAVETASLQAEAPEPLAPARYFPLAPGDRIRVAVTPTDARHNEGVTGVDARGVAAVFGTAHASGERYRATATEVAMVTPAGEPVVTVLKAPIRAGARFSYTLSEAEVSIPCEVSIDAVDAQVDVAGTTLTRCATLVRRCIYPAGHPFPFETTHTTDETFCPDVGRVRERGVFRPPPPTSAIPSEREERVIYYRIAGAPTLTPPTSGCDGTILLPTDVIAACGADVAPVEPLAGRALEGGGCEYAFTRGDAPLAIRFGAPFDDPAPEGDATSIIVATRGRAHVEVRAPEGACSADGLARLTPLLRSLVE